MSYNELRDFAGVMKVLGFPTELSINSFRRPNFILMASCAKFLIRMHTPDISIADDISTPQDRVFFLGSICAQTLSRLHIRLSPLALYRADALAVRELLKLARPLLSALCAVPSLSLDPVSPKLDAAILTETKTLGEELITLSTTVCKQVGNVPAWHQELSEALERQQDVRLVAEATRGRSESIRNAILESEMKLTQLNADIAHIQEQLGGRSRELQNIRQQSQNLANVRPPFMDELEKLEALLAELHTKWVTKFRSLQFLESQLDLQDAQRRQSRQKELLERQPQGDDDDIELIAQEDGGDITGSVVTDEEMISGQLSLGDISDSIPVNDDIEIGAHGGGVGTATMREQNGANLSRQSSNRTNRPRAARRRPSTPPNDEAAVILHPGEGPLNPANMGFDGGDSFEG